MSLVRIPRNALVVCPQDRRHWILVEPFGFSGTVAGSRYDVRVPSRFITDFASIPWPITLMLPRWGSYGWAAVIHDYMYWEQSETRLEADLVLRDIMHRSDVSYPVRQAIYLAVRGFGFMAWRSNARLRAAYPRARFARRIPRSPIRAKREVARMEMKKAAATASPSERAKKVEEFVRQERLSGERPKEENGP